YNEEKAQSEAIDLGLGFGIPRVEASLSSALTHQLWEHLSSQVFQTPYAELLRILRELNPSAGDLVIDLGAAYGRMAFVMEAFFPEVFFLGYECSLERVAEAKRVMSAHHLRNSRMIHQDMESAGFEPEKAQHYFIYDFGTRSAIAKVLSDLKKIAGQGPIQVAARGRASRDAIERDHPWLSQVHLPRHFGHYSIYRS
ncbi:SAM-dependent methyltransferase, partial [bacterium]|nr:SAM-dependent methyltransferase [bacterium]